MLLKRTWLAILILTSLILANGHLQVAVHASDLDQRIGMACSFLKTLYDPSLHLVRETRTRFVYHIASDNLLAQAALRDCMPDLSLSIRSALYEATCCAKGNDLMHESILGLPIPLPIHVAIVFNVSDYTVDYENHNGTGILSPFAYADVAVYSGFEQERRGNYSGTVEMVRVLNAMWEGKGMIDEVYKNGRPGELGVYQTFKVALYLLLLKGLSFPIPSRLMKALVRMQGLDGGFHTGFVSNLTYAATDENTETTSIAIIAMKTLSEQPPLDFLRVMLVLVPSIALTILLFLLRRRSSRKASPV